LRARREVASTPRGLSGAHGNVQLPGQLLSDKKACPFSSQRQPISGFGGHR
jgi:hypothetical protein